MPSGKLKGTTLKLITGREVTDGHSLFSNTNCKIIGVLLDRTTTDRN
jgi:hypothetical protein